MRTPYLSPFKFACDQNPAQGVIVGHHGPCTIVRGTGADEGTWFARGKGQTRRFNSRQEAMDWAKANAKDSSTEHMRRFKTQDCAQDKLPDFVKYAAWQAIQALDARDGGPGSGPRPGGGSAVEGLKSSAGTNFKRGQLVRLSPQALNSVRGGAFKDADLEVVSVSSGSAAQLAQGNTKGNITVRDRKTGSRVQFHPDDLVIK